MKTKGSEAWRTERRTTVPQMLCARTQGTVTQACFLLLLHILLGHHVTSSVPSVPEIFVRKVKITKKLFMWHLSWQEAHTHLMCPWTATFEQIGNSQQDEVAVYCDQTSEVANYCFFSRVCVHIHTYEKMSLCVHIVLSFSNIQIYFSPCWIKLPRNGEINQLIYAWRRKASP